MGSLAWRVTYQHGRLPAWEKRERAQGRSSSGFCESIWYSTLLFLSGMARRRIAVDAAGGGARSGVVHANLKP